MSELPAVCCVIHLSNSYLPDETIHNIKPTDKKILEHCLKQQRKVKFVPCITNHELGKMMQKEPCVMFGWDGRGLSGGGPSDAKLAEIVKGQSVQVMQHPIQAMQQTPELNLMFGLLIVEKRQ